MSSRFVIAQLDFVFDSDICDRYLDDIESLGDASDPFVATASYNVAAVNFDGVGCAVHHSSSPVNSSEARIVAQEADR